jgi:hypothetical protein
LLILGRGPTARASGYPLGSASAEKKTKFRFYISADERIFIDKKPPEKGIRR